MKKITAFIMSIFLLLSYYFSFLPSKNDKNFDIPVGGYSDGNIFVNGKNVPVEVNESSECGTVVYDFKEHGSGWFNYFGIKYKTDCYMSAEITYKLRENTHSEVFYLEPSDEEAAFYSFIDDFLKNEKAYILYNISFTPLNKEEAHFELLGVGLFNRKVPKKNVLIETDKYKLGIDLNWGGALSYLEDMSSNVQAVKKDGRIYVDSNAAKRYRTVSVNNHVNLINRYDEGRLVQQSYYGTEGENGEFGEAFDSVWRYNPVQGGNKFNEASKLVDVTADGNHLYVKCRPLSWALPAENFCPAYMEAEYTIDGKIVNVSCRFVDFSGYAPCVSDQEMPAFYCIEPFNRFFYASEDGGLKCEPKLGFWTDFTKSSFTSSENWAAFVGEFDDSFGIGLYVPDCRNFVAGTCNREQTTKTDPSRDASTSYIAAINGIEFMSFKPIEYSFCITTGTVNEIRAAFADKR